MEDLIEQLKFSSVDSNSKHVAFITAVDHREKNSVPKSEITVRRISDGKTVNHVMPDQGESPDLFRFSPDGQRFVYKSTKGEKQYLVIGKIDVLSEERILLPENVTQIEWVGSELFVLMKDSASPEKKKEIEKGYDGSFFEEDVLFSSLYKYVPGFGFEKLTDGVQVWEFSYSNGNIAMVASDSPREDSWYESKLYIPSRGKNGCKMVYDPNPRTLTRPQFSPDGKKIAFLESHWSDRGVTAGDIIILNLENNQAENITMDEKRSYTDLTWSQEDVISALFLESPNFGIARYSGHWTDIWSAIGSVQPHFAPEFSFNGKSYYIAYSSPETPAEICAVDTKGKFERITQLNSHLYGLKAQPFEIVDWKSPDGMTAHGIIRYTNPDNPLVVLVHGGPTSSSTVDFIDYSTVYLDMGFSVFMPNYRGSTGYGRKYAESNVGDMGGGDLEDILAGVEFLKKSGKVSTDKLFISGGSYGGYITNLAVTKTDIFTAAAGLFGMSDWLSFHATTGITVWDSLYYRGSVYDMESKHWLFNPLTFVDGVKTPLLLIHGANDPVVPVGQSYEMYRKMKEKGKIVRLLVFQREGHGFSEKYHRLAMMDEIIKWFRKFL